METMEDHRQFWVEVAKSNGWYEDPFYVVVWDSPDGQIVDSVSYVGLACDMRLDN
jgi:hypothetical protein